MKPHYLSPFFTPQSIAISGMEEQGSSIGNQMLSNLIRSGYGGRLYPIHPLASHIDGLIAYRTLEEIQEPVDLVMLANPIEDIPGLIAQCGQLGMHAVVLLTNGFGESGAQGARTFVEVQTQARAHGVRYLGPNRIGVIRPAIGLTPPLVKAGGIALVSQSTALTCGVLDWAAGNGIGFSAVVSINPSSDIDFAEIVDYLVSDLQTQSILMFIESVGHPRHFMSTLREAARVKPVIVLKSDRWGHLSGPMHHIINQGGYPSMLQSDAIFDAALRRAGVVRVRNLTQLFSAARACAVRYRRSGARLAVLSNGDGPGALASDRAMDNRIPLARLSSDTLTHLEPLMPTSWDGSNPLNLGSGAKADRFTAVANLVLSDPEVDSLLVILTPQFDAEPLETAQQLDRLSKQTTKPILACWMGDRSVLPSRAILSAAQIPNFRTPESALDAFHYMALYHRNQQMLFQTPPPSDENKAPLLEQARQLLDSVRARQALELGTRETEQLLGFFHVVYRAGLPPPLFSGHDAELRAVSLGIIRDPTLGPALFLGPTGIAAEIPGSKTWSLPPLNPFLAHELIDRSTIANQLNQHEAIRAINHDDLICLLMRLSDMACELPQVEEIHLQAWFSPEDAPLISRAHITLGDTPAPRTRYGHMAVHPYPADLVREVTLRNGTHVILRPIRPEDAEMEQAFVKSLSDDTRYFRFMDALRELPRSMLVRFTQLDYEREIALVAITQQDDAPAQIGVVRYAANPDGESCEFALVIGDEWQRHGLGQIMMEYLMEIAARRGLKVMEGEVLGSNSGMLHLMTRLGFAIRTSPEDPSIRAVSRSLEAVSSPDSA